MQLDEARRQPGARHYLGTRPRTEAAAASLLIVCAVAAIYRGAVISYFFNDDFNWLDEAQRFAFANLLHLGRYNHFYRPVVEIYFFAARRLFGCAALPFHLLSVGIHLVTTLLVYLFARDLSGRRHLGFVAALFFCTQPGYYEAVSWVAAITDLLPGLWYLLTLWLFLRYLRSARLSWYLAALCAFTLCLFTHESSATLLPVLIVLDLAEAGGLRAFQASGGSASVRTRVLRYAPFAVLLAASLTIAYVVNSRSYLIREGHYQFGWHAVPHVLQFILSLYVGPRSTASYLLIVAVLAALLWRGSPRVRFAVVFLLATLAPASFFTWGNVSRYLYVPAAAFALLLAEGVVALEAWLASRLPPRTARAAAAVVAFAIAFRFAVYAEKSGWTFRDLTRPYERFVSAVRRVNPAGSNAAPIALAPGDVENIPVAFYDVAAGAAFCGPPLHVVVP